MRPPEERRSAPESLKQWALSLRAAQFEVATRASVSVALPLVVLLLTDHLDWAAYAAFGAMTSLFGRNEPYRVRLRTVTVAGVLMLSFIALGLVLAVAQASLLVLTLGLVVVISLGIVVASTAGLFPATPIFFVFGYAVVAQVPTPGRNSGRACLLPWPPRPVRGRSPYRAGCCADSRASAHQPCTRTCSVGAA